MTVVGRINWFCGFGIIRRIPDFASEKASVLLRLLRAVGMRWRRVRGSADVRRDRDNRPSAVWDADAPCSSRRLPQGSRQMRFHPLSRRASYEQDEAGPG